MSHRVAWGACALIFFSFFTSLPAHAQNLPSPSVRFCEVAYNVYFSKQLIKRFNVSKLLQPIAACFEKGESKMSLDMLSGDLHIDFFRTEAGGLNRIEVMRKDSAAKPDSVVIDKVVVRGNYKHLVSADNDKLGVQVRPFPKESRMVRIHAYNMSARDIFSLFEKTGRYKFHIVGKADLSKVLTFNFIAIPDRVIFILLSEELNLTGSEVMSVVKEGRLDYIYSEKLTDEKQ